jgi:hypothetical protein
MSFFSKNLFNCAVYLQQIYLLRGTNHNHKTLVGWASCPPMLYLITLKSAVCRQAFLAVNQY